MITILVGVFFQKEPIDESPFLNYQNICILRLKYIILRYKVKSSGVHDKAKILEGKLSFLPITHFIETKIYSTKKSQFHLLLES